jgi:hypothetical protein
LNWMDSRIPSFNHTNNGRVLVDGMYGSSIIQIEKTNRRKDTKKMVQHCELSTAQNG